MVAASSFRARASVRLLFASASIAITRLPAFAKASAVNRAAVVFPTPPLRLEKTITLTVRYSWVAAASASGCHHREFDRQREQDEGCSSGRYSADRSALPIRCRCRLVGPALPLGTKRRGHGASYRQDRNRVLVPSLLPIDPPVIMNVPSTPYLCQGVRPS